jgi:hypothetical protein
VTDSSSDQLVRNSSGRHKDLHKISMISNLDMAARLIRLITYQSRASYKIDNKWLNTGLGSSPLKSDDKNYDKL